MINLKKESKKSDLQAVIDKQKKEIKGLTGMLYQLATDPESDRCKALVEKIKTWNHLNKK
jgi:hypothetical protein